MSNDLSTWLKYAQFQMAAEAFLIDREFGTKLYSGDALKTALIKGNDQTKQTKRVRN